VREQDRRVDDALGASLLRLAEGLVDLRPRRGACVRAQRDPDGRPLAVISLAMSTTGPTFALQCGPQQLSGRELRGDGRSD
jgi:hypothetical protein